MNRRLKRILCGVMCGSVLGLWAVMPNAEAKTAEEGEEGDKVLAIQLRLIDLGYNVPKANGVFEEIYVKYFYTHSDTYLEAQNRRTLYIAGGVMLAIVSILALMQLIIRRLKRSLSVSLSKVEAANTQLEAANAALRQRYQEIQALAYTNSVTGLPNKNEFRQSFVSASLDGDTARRVVLYLDLDSF